MLNSSKKKMGFSLLEVLIVILIVSILATFGVRLSRAQVVKAQRHTAKVALFQAASQLELFYQKHHTYESASLEKLNIPSRAEVRGYEIQLAGLSQTGFLIRAIPVGAQASDDLVCGILTIDQTGRRMITGMGSVNDCWFY